MCLTGISEKWLANEDRIHFMVHTLATPRYRVSLLNYVKQNGEHD
ncbi:acyl-CoA hydrolase [Labrenzia sp. EL_208]|nr:acyl-CoA hydrolase [Labrenzia sp. EL_132]MBG6231731.1 acyl-CoA hydrolase [Labrenzia sp. EL_208]